MATAAPPSDGYDLQDQMVDWLNLRYSNMAVGILRSVVFFSPLPRGVIQEPNLRLWIDVSTLCRSSPFYSLLERDNRVSCLDLPLSQLFSLREVLPDLVLGRPELDDGHADFLYGIVDRYVCECVQYFLWAHQGTNSRMLAMEIEVSVVIDEAAAADPHRPPAPVPRLERVVYGRHDNDDDGRGGGRAPPEVRETACPICLQDFFAGDEVGVTPCAHPFHPDCLVRWLERKPFCPLCRSLVPCN